MRGPWLIAAAVTLVAGAAQAQDGQRLAQLRCGSCHAVDKPQNRMAAHLVDLAGRQAGSVEGARYTDALRNSGIVWDRQTLDAYLANPRQRVPGTSMMVSLANEAERAAIVEYLIGGAAAP
jgi:cytochrome c